MSAEEIEKSQEEPLKWYIVKAKSNCEKRVQAAIQRLVEDQGLQDQVQQVLVPEKEVIQVIKGKKVSRCKKFYPGYVFIQMCLTNEIWHLIKQISHVINFVGRQGRPTEVPAQQITAITQQMTEDSEHPDSQVVFSVGEYVKVIDGPFKTFSGVVEEVNQEKQRVKVSVSIFGRPTPVELDFSQVHREE